MKKQILFSWSGGKDSAIALYQVLEEGDYEVAALLTTITEDYDRISIHGVRRSLLEAQAERKGLPLEIVFIPKDASNELYESRMRETLEDYKCRGVTAVAFGDIFLEDLRRHREEKLEQVEMSAIFSIWKKDTCQLAKEFISLGFQAVITCVDTEVLDKSFVGRKFDHQFLDDLPSDIDPCGENGEFHSFVYDGPIFKRAIQYKKGKTVLREGRFCFCDLMPKKSECVIS